MKPHWRLGAALILCGPALRTAAAGTPDDPRGTYFSKKAYDPHPLPDYAKLKDQLPAPILASHPEWVALYWKAWEIAFHNFHEPEPGSHFVSQFIDAAFNKNTFLWDTCFMSMFCNVAHPLVPGIESLDNFYARQHADGEIGREIVRSTGLDYAPWVDAGGRPLFSRNGFNADSPDSPVKYRGRPVPEPAPRLTLDAVDNPLPAWAELESYRVTGDRDRIARVYPPLAAYYGAIRKYLRQGNGLYVTDWASMDNSPRNRYLANGGTAVDTSSQMVLFARQLSEMAGMLGKDRDRLAFALDARELSGIINRLMWNPDRRFYFDLTQDGRQAPVRTVAAYWTLLAEVAPVDRARALVQALGDPDAFGRRNQVPTLPADEKGFDPMGGYWRGSVWAPTTMMVIRGLERYGRAQQARQIALGNLRLMSAVLQKTGTIWENYAPDSESQGRPAKDDFVGWSGLGPIDWLLEYALGLKPDAPDNTLDWTPDPDGRSGCRNYRFNGHVCSLEATPLGGGRFRYSVDADEPFLIRLGRDGDWKTVNIGFGPNAWSD
ncbi:MAG TPA: trehalase family glycosidase [Opitutaceae bacterium]|jgi:hypothetical protein